jgi:hypothetical protein
VGFFYFSDVFRHAVLMLLRASPRVEAFAVPDAALIAPVGHPEISAF